MPELTEQARLKRDSRAAWAEIGDSGAVGDWHPIPAGESGSVVTWPTRFDVTGDDERQAVEMVAA